MLNSDDLLGKILDTVTRNEFGGCNPGKDPEITLKAKVENRIIYVFCVGKWRPIRHYNSTAQTCENKRIMADVERTVRMNAGWKDNPKPIKFTWIVE